MRKDCISPINPLTLLILCSINNDENVFHGLWKSYCVSLKIRPIPKIRPGLIFPCVPNIRPIPKISPPPTSSHRLVVQGGARHMCKMKLGGRWSCPTRTAPAYLTTTTARPPTPRHLSCYCPTSAATCSRMPRGASRHCRQSHAQQRHVPHGLLPQVAALAQ